MPMKKRIGPPDVPRMCPLSGCAATGKGIKASFVLTDYQGKIYISARSIDEVNVQIIMERMGGGGHMNTAACQMEGTGLIEAIGALKRTIDSMLENNEI